MHRLAVRGLIALATLDSAATQEATNSARSPGPFTLSPIQNAEPAGDALSPQNLLQFEYQYKTAPGTDLNGDPDTVVTETYKLRGDLSFDLCSSWQLVFRGDLPLIVKNPVTNKNPDGDFIHGVGDADAQAAMIHAFDERWKAGAGVRLISPTGGDTFGTGKWQVEPVIGFRYALLELGPGNYVEPLVRWDYSFAGNPTKKNINNIQFAPIVNFALPDRWFFTLYPSTDIRWNFGDPATGQNGKLFLPFDARIGKQFSDFFNVSLEVGVPIVKQYPVYNFMTALRINLIF